VGFKRPQSVQRAAHSHVGNPPKTTGSVQDLLNKSKELLLAAQAKQSSSAVDGFRWKWSLAGGMLRHSTLSGDTLAAVIGLLLHGTCTN